MLNAIAFANSAATVTGLLYLVLSVLAMVWREGFRFLFNAQFFGADVASLLPRELTAGVFVGTLVALVVGAWLVGYAWASLSRRV
jgi:2TM family of unknown function (DUF5676)